MVTAKTIGTADKGDPIRFISGVYDGETGWFDSSNAHTPKMYYVIVDNDNGKGIYTRVGKSSVADHSNITVTSPFTAALKKVPALEKEMNALCKTLVMCKITEVTPEIMELLQENIKKVATQHQKGKKGHPAVVYNIDPWDDELDTDAISMKDEM
jgi:hypothetical protein